MKKLLVYLLAFGIITGIIPILMLILMEKSLIFTILVGITAFVWTAKELCF